MDSLGGRLATATGQAALEPQTLSANQVALGQLPAHKFNLVANCETNQHAQLWLASLIGCKPTDFLDPQQLSFVALAESSATSVAAMAIKSANG